MTTLGALSRNTPYSTTKKRVLYLFYCGNIHCSSTWNVLRSSIESNSTNVAKTIPHEEKNAPTDDWLQSAGINIHALTNDRDFQNNSECIKDAFTNDKLVQKSYLINYISEKNIDDGDIKIKRLLDSYLSNTDDPIEIKKGSDSDVSSSESSMEYFDPSSIDENDYVSDKDKYMHHFSAEISKFPKQIVRYCFGGTPLYSESPKKITIPKCKECGSDKVFEFQIISTLIYEWEKLFGEDDVFVKCNTDWSTIIVYTCYKDCNVELFEESILMQYLK